ncbi:MAG: fibrobacter succinogenes major paralogous domain-containing protein [Prolixibacteraceae bacterium]|nr:fibrobacter succinogenes major paralogous domain-containing protein [Prolixibacteraceae bacterium]
MKASSLGTLKQLLIASVFFVLLVSCNKEVDPSPDQKNGVDSGVKSYGTYTDSRDQHVYRTIKIGTQIWMAENLAYLPMVCKPSKISRTASCFYIYGYDGINVNEAKQTKNYSIYGVLYNWNAATEACPKGWHLPSADEWDVLENYLINNGYGYEGTGDDLAKSMAFNSIWNYFSLDGTIGHETTTNNKSGFSALPAGCFSGFGDFFGIYECTYMWTSTQKDVKYAWFRNLEDHDSVLGGSVVVKENGFSVRCLKD